MRTRVSLAVVAALVVLCGGVAVMGVAQMDTTTAQTATESTDDELVVTLENDSGDVGTTVEVPVTVAEGTDGPDEVEGHEFIVEYDPNVVEPTHDPGDVITFQDDSGQLGYTVGDTDPGILQFSTLDSGEIPFGSAGEFGEPLSFEVRTDDAVETTIDATASFDEDEDGGEEFTVSYEPATITTNAEPEPVDGLLGDVTQTGNVTIRDAVAIQRESLGLDPGESFADARADVNRDGDVTIRDAVLAQRISLGLTDGATVSVTELDAPAEATVGDELLVTGTITNTGDVGTVEPVEYRVDGTVESSRTVDLGTNETDRHNTTVGFLLDTSGFDAGELTHGLFGDENKTVTTTLEEQPEAATFELTSFDAPSETFVDEQYEVDATVENIGEEDGEVTITYQYDGETVDDETVTVTAGEQETVTLEYTPTEVETVPHSVTADDDELSAEIEIVEEDEPEVSIDLGDATGEDTVEIPITVAEGAVDPPESIDGSGFTVEYDETLLSPAYEDGDVITLEDASGDVSYTVGADPDDGELVFNTLEEAELPFGSEGDLGDALEFDVVTDESVETTVTVTADFDEDVGGQFVVEYDDSTVGLNQ